MSGTLVARFFLAFSLIGLFCGRADGGGVFLTWNPSPDPSVIGYFLRYGISSTNYTTVIDVQGSESYLLDGLEDGVTYHFAVGSYNKEGYPSPNSADLPLQIPFPPQILFQSSSQIVQAGAQVNLFIDVIGSPPLNFQWFDGTNALADATNSSLTLSGVSDANAGTYKVVVSNPDGAQISSPVSVTVIDPSPTAGAIPGDLGSQLAADGVQPTGKMLAVLAAPSLAVSMSSVAGGYSGLFYQVDDQGLPDVDIATAGFLSNCVVDATGNFSGALYAGGLPYPISGAFDASGNADTTVSRSSLGLSDLNVGLRLDLSAGALQMTGLVSNMDTIQPWTSTLIAGLQTNLFAQPPNFTLTISPTDILPGGTVSGRENNGTFVLFGTLLDGSVFLNYAPITLDGTVPLYAPLYGGSGLLSGWVNACCDPPTAFLTWICPSSSLSAGFTNLFEASVQPYVPPSP